MQPKILLVDDRDDNLLSVEAILKPDGYEFSKANSGRQALKILLSEFDFALILMDVKMPNLNGIETASLIYEREKLKHIPIIFITAHSSGDESIFKGYRAGAVDYIYKPFNPELLRAKVAVFIELYKKNYRLMAQEQKLMTINRNLESEINEHKISEEKIKALNHQLVESVDQLETVNKDLDHFAFMASHDLQEPLRKIRMYSDKLFSKYQDGFDEEGKMYLSRLQNSAERMQALIKDILTFSKMAIEKNTFENSDLNILLNEEMEEIETAVNEKNAIILIDPLPTLYVNPRLIKLLFNNLISNSLKYSKMNTRPVIRIYSETNLVDEAEKGKTKVDKYCRIFVEDNGIGFEQQYAEHIFGMFKRLHSNADFEGTGIGLALCKKIVDEHQGFISARSKVDEGSTFIISIPLNLSKKIKISSRHKNYS